MGVSLKGSRLHICSSDLQASLWGPRSVRGTGLSWDLEEGNKHPGPHAAELWKAARFPEEFSDISRGKELVAVGYGTEH